MQFLHSDIEKAYCVTARMYYYSILNEFMPFMYTDYKN